MDTADVPKWFLYNELGGSINGSSIESDNQSVREKVAFSSPGYITVTKSIGKLST